MNKYKKFEELKEELGNNYDLFMYEINLCLLQKIDKAIEYIKHSWWLRTDQVYDTSKDLKDWEVIELLEILEGNNNE